MARAVSKVWLLRGAGAGSASTVLSSHSGDVECRDGRSQELGHGLDPATTSAGGESFGLVGGKGQVVEGEKVLECTGERAHRPSGSAGPFKKCPGRVGVLVFQEPSQVGDEAAGSGDAVAGRDLGDEIGEPFGRVVESFPKVFAANEGTAGVLLPAG
ncbi:hypothetical protein [Streptomyces sp. Ru62]|uniref:hypothetical protein n=1 Tax=Streptomyces sp. Ru62 TaxID=2080745 RepID=UPI001CA58DD4|nr:hypothetical protein [Streptomyces sp. Ru62]